MARLCLTWAFPEEGAGSGAVIQDLCLSKGQFGFQPISGRLGNHSRALGRWCTLGGSWSCCVECGFFQAHPGMGSNNILRSWDRVRDPEKYEGRRWGKKEDSQLAKSQSKENPIALAPTTQQFC